MPSSSTIIEESKRKRFAATDESDRVAESVIGDPTDEERERERERRRRRDWSSNGCDKSSELSRPKLGGRERPYPRRCRTGRQPTDTDNEAESRVEKPLPMYVPRDKQSESKQDTFAAGRLKAVLHHLVPSLKASILAEVEATEQILTRELEAVGLRLKKKPPQVE
ncbi:hypothetical protein F2Q69_00060981 [Brassica cretica]|uniref:Lipoxygenase domain-containing protein n=1 Tax=Brassica cretica TaxID=69181 RepID=A0A8S9RI51_BRACR|nr:hypothetical protein F2Q69_00060981 [Brassica cretica]